MKIHDPGNDAPIDEFYVWLSVDKKGNEGVAAINVRGQWFTAVSGKLRVALLMEKQIKPIADQLPDKKFSLVKFTSREVIKTLGAENVSEGDKG